MPQLEHSQSAEWGAAPARGRAKAPTAAKDAWRALSAALGSCCRAAEIITIDEACWWRRSRSGTVLQCLTSTRCITSAIGDVDVEMSVRLALCVSRAVI